ncbi:hypothetical protein [Saccharomonospora viridis]|jgi:hypothetical protein|uniref:hypothetical protein n=1 Tax=Saccharomonospora viridis TaxID=1852 RepID=UPI0023F322B0|nr:hypothetical protein [Saccharomonospora viridis]
MTTENGTDGAQLADEIRLLVDLVVERAKPWLDSVLEAGHGHGHTDTGTEADTPTGAAGTGAEGSQWCPLCAVVAVFRGERVDVAARIVEHVTQLLALLRAVLADRWAPEDGIHMPGFRPAPNSQRPEERRDGRVQHVTVRPRSQWEPDAGDRD